MRSVRNETGEVHADETDSCVALGRTGDYHFIGCGLVKIQQRTKAACITFHLFSTS
jgi:hypothetical protein